MRFLYLSGNEDTVFLVAKAFGVQLSQVPPFASQILFELWRNGSSGANSTYYVKFYYQTEEQQLKGACANATKCEYSTFLQTAQSLAFDGNWKDECSKTVSRSLTSLGVAESEEGKSNNIFYLVLTLVLVCALMLFVVGLVLSNYESKKQIAHEYVRTFEHPSFV